jgi:hypothetical protein
MPSELIPFQSLIIININLFEQLNEILNKTNFIPCLRQVNKHYLDELLQCETLSFTFHEIFFDLLQFSIIQMTHDIIVIIIFIEVSIFLYRLFNVFAVRLNGFVIILYLHSSIAILALSSGVMSSYVLTTPSPKF